MIIIKNFGGYNARRYSAPWGARVTFAGVKPRFNFEGRWDGSAVAIEANLGDILAFGQKDNRGNGTTKDYYIVGKACVLEPVTEKTAREHYHLVNEMRDIITEDEVVAALTRPAVQERHYNFDTSVGTWTEGEWHGTEDASVTATEIGPDHWKLACNIYYTNSGVFELEITQPLDRALRVFMAALVADQEVADQECEGRF